MILNLDQQDGIKIGAEGLNMGIDLTDTSKIFYILSQGFYSDPKRAIIQETISNCIDAYTEINKDILENPAQIILTDESICFKDFGVGIDEERMNKIMSKFFASTKTKSETQLGHFGLGSKVSFAYTNQFTIISTHGNVKRTWLFSKDHTQIEIIKLNEEQVDEENQTSFIIPLTDDPKLWYQKVIETIPYFKGVLFVCRCNKWWNESDKFNSVKIVEGNTFYYSKNAPNYFHICLDQVIYKVDLNDLNTSFYSIEFPFALKFTASEGIIPTPNRENILLTEATKSLILSRLKECIEELQNYYEKESLTLPEYFADSNHIKINIPDHEIRLKKRHIDKLCETLKVPEFIKYDPIFSSILNLSNKSSFFYECITKRQHIQKTRICSTYSHDIKQSIICDKINPAQNRFLREKYSGYYTIKINKQKLFGRNGFFENLGLSTVPRNLWRGIIEAWIEEQKAWLKNAIPFPEDEYQQWLKQQVRNTTNRKKLQNEEVKIGYLQTKERGVGFKISTGIYNVNELRKDLVYVHFSEITWEATKFFELQAKKVIPIIVDDVNLAKIKKNKSITCLSSEDFMKTKYFKRLVFKYWVYKYAYGVTSYIKNCYFEHNGILKEHYNEIDNLRYNGFKNLPGFLGNYELDIRYKPIEDYFRKVEEKAQRLTLSLENDSYGHKAKKKLFVSNFKIKRLEKELNKLKTNHKLITNDY